MTARTWVLRLPWERPPITLNQRHGYRAHARLVAGVRPVAENLARAAKVPGMLRPTVTLVWLVDTRHRRDADNVVPTLKALCDGLVDAGVARDDTPDFMHKVMPIISYAKGHPGVPGMFLVIWEATRLTSDEVRALREAEVAA